ncbi:MAG: hypothetical protein JXB47_19020 [Anaerolineae bacterium]|nr:hypothetical protein [Anaerolineae bacterium]
MPDFSQMSPEEAMAWLETLAKRQGVAEEELTTSANVEIAEVPADAVVDEPGYTPYDPTGKRSKAQAEETPPAQPEPPPAPIPPAPAPQPVAEESGDLEATIMEDPMAWLETLAKRQGVGDEELTTSADMPIIEPPPDTVVDEPGYTPFDPFGRPGPYEPDRPAAPAPAEAQKPEVEATPSMAEDFADTKPDAEDLMMSDPMKWLESLAKRQGVSEAELTTMADMEIEEPPPDSVIDEPGYIPFRELEKQKKGGPEVEAKAPPQEPVPPPEPAAPDLELSTDDLFDDDLDLVPAELPDWLKPARMVDLPDIPGLDEPARPAPAPSPPEPVAESDELAWLDALADQTADDVEFDFSSLPVARAAGDDAADPFAGMSEDEIEALAAGGYLTPEQQQAWVDRQLESLVENRLQMEDTSDADTDSLEPAVPGEVPDWLRQQMPQPPDALDRPAAPGEIPDWLAEQMPEGMELDEVAMDSGAADGMPDWLTEQALDDLGDADLIEPAPDDMPDWLSAVAQETQTTGSVDADAWLDSLAEETGAFGLAEEAEEVEDFDQDMTPPLPKQEDLPPGEPSELPVWFTEADLEAPESKEAEVDSLDWLAEAQALGDIEVDFEESDISAWLAEQHSAPLIPNGAPDEPPEEAPASLEADLSWLEEADLDIAFPPLDFAQEEEEEGEEAEEAIPPPRVLTQPKAPPPQPSRPAPPPQPSQPRPAPAAEAPPLKIDASPQQVTQWLSEARTLKDEGDFEASMDKYENLVLAEQHLDDLANDLEAIARQLATSIRVRRLLGDVYMRQNNLQQALDTYRGALDQL